MRVRHFSQRRIRFFFFFFDWLGGAWTRRFNLTASAPDAFDNLQILQGFSLQEDLVGLPVKHLTIINALMVNICYP